MRLTEQKIELTDEQVKALKDSGLFNGKDIFKPKYKETYYRINGKGNIEGFMYANDKEDRALIKAANCCTDKELLKQRALHEILSRRLWRFSVQCGELENKWNNKNEHWYVYYETIHKMLCTIYANCIKCDIIYFPKEEDANRAIDEIIKPFMLEYPEFRW